MRNVQIFDSSFRTYQSCLLKQARPSTLDISSPVDQTTARPELPRPSDFIADFLKIARTALSAKGEPIFLRAFEEFYVSGAENPDLVIKRLRVRPEIFDILRDRVRHVAGGAFFKAKLWPAHVYFGN